MQTEAGGATLASQVQRPGGWRLALYKELTELNAFAAQVSEPTGAPSGQMKVKLVSLMSKVELALALAKVGEGHLQKVKGLRRLLVFQDDCKVSWMWVQ